jgi:hypothetical protein
MKIKGQDDSSQFRKKQYIYMYRGRWRRAPVTAAAEEEGEEVSLGVIMTNTEIFYIFHIFSLFNLIWKKPKLNSEMIWKI